MGMYDLPILSLKETTVPRFLVHVNYNRGQKRICVHRETERSCPSVFLNVKVGRPQEGEFRITGLGKNTFRTAEVEHSYWLIVWSIDEASVLRNHFVRKAQTEFRIPTSKVKKCEHCSK